jgi:hypothetical protein
MIAFVRGYLNRSRPWDIGAGALIFALVIGSEWCPWLRAGVAFVFDGKRVALFSAIAAIAGSLLGFAIASVSIVLTVAQMPRLKVVRKSKHYRALWLTFHSTIWCLALTTVTALVGLAIDSDARPNLFVTALVAGTCTTAGLRVFNAIWILEQIVRIATGPDEVA